MSMSEHRNAIHDHLAAALLALAAAVAADNTGNCKDLVEIARLLTAAQQKLHDMSRATRTQAPIH